MKYTPFFLPTRMLLGLLVSMMFIMAPHVSIGSHGDPYVGHVVMIGVLFGLIARVATRRFFD